MQQKIKNRKDHSDYYYLSKITNQQKALKKIVNSAEYRRIKKYEEHPEDVVQFGVIEKEGLGSEKERTAYTQLINDIGMLYVKASN